MNNFKLRGKCDSCNKVKWFIAQRQIMLPIGQKATSHDYYCRKCNKGLQVAIKNIQPDHE